MINNAKFFKFEEMKRIGITGQQGFLGSHLYNTLGLTPKKYKRIFFKKEYFETARSLDSFVGKCDVIIHLAAMNRHKNPEILYNKNVELVQLLIASLKRTNSKAHILFSSSLQEERNNLYGKSKKEGRKLFLKWAKENNGTFTGLIIPNVFGAFGRPNYNSFVATFCYKLTHDEVPQVDVDRDVNLVYVDELVEEIIGQIEQGCTNENYEFSCISKCKVSEVLSKLENFKKLYFEKGEIPELKSQFDLNLFNTYRSFIDYRTRFPIKFRQHIDARGRFVEVVRLGVGGQCSFSTTASGVTRGNHYHTRKVERFAVIKGKALIQLRKVDGIEVLEFYLDGNEPAYVDIPIWYAHNIKNVGKEELYTIFWINELYDSKDADTYFTEVVIKNI